MKNKIIKNRNGFTLMETVLYLAIVGILFVAVINFHLILGGSATKLSSNINTSSNRRIALSKIDYLIRNADGMLKDIYGDCSDFSEPSLALYFSDDTYLPEGCVGSGGAVKISLNDKRVLITCYPGISYNGQYAACDTTSSDSYYLTTLDVAVGNNDLIFSTSSDDSDSNSFLSISTYLRTSIISNDQVDLRAESLATSTTVLRNEQPSGLITWWRMDEGTGTTTVDSAGDNPAGCYPSGGEPSWAAGIVSSSPYALDFEHNDPLHTCMSFDPATETQTNPDDLNFDDQFTITAWVKPEAFNDSVQHKIMSKTQWSNQKGYVMQLLSVNQSANCRVFDGTTYADVDSANSSIVAGNTYHISCVYDLNNNRLQIYVYESGIGLISTSTYNGTVPILVNDVMEPHIAYPGSGSDGNFDGIIDEVRFYNRALSDEEIYALHTQAP